MAALLRLLAKPERLLPRSHVTPLDSSPTCDLADRSRSALLSVRFPINLLALRDLEASIVLSFPEGLATTAGLGHLLRHTRHVFRFL